MTVSINIIYQNVMKFSNMMSKTTKRIDNKSFWSKIGEKLVKKNLEKSQKVSNISKTAKLRI